jgi:hypothetical protein
MGRAFLVFEPETHEFDFRVFTLSELGARNLTVIVVVEVYARDYVVTVLLFTSNLNSCES